MSRAIERRRPDPGMADDGDALHFCSTCAFSSACLSQGYDKSDLQDLHVLVEHIGPFAEGTLLFREGDPFNAIAAVRAGMVKTSKNQASAVNFLEYLSSDDAQRYFADGNNEWPVVAGLKIANPALDKLGSFKADTLPVESLAMNRAKAQMIFDRAGYR